MPIQQEIEQLKEDKIREEQRKKTKIRNDNTLSIMVIDNGITIKDGDKEFDFVFFKEFDNDAINKVKQFISRRKQIVNPGKSNNRGESSKRNRLGDRREIRRPIKMNSIEDAF